METKEKAKPKPTEEKTANKEESKILDVLGYPNGPEITNKDTVLKEIDAALGVNKPPAIEYLFVEPHAGYSILGIGIPMNPYGHAAIRYTLPTGEQIVMNITGVPGGEMVNMMKPEDYLFGTHHFGSGAEQGGIYNRSIVGVRIENYPADLIEDLHHYYKKVQRREKEVHAKFSLMLAPVYNFIASHVPALFPIAERGNCALWTSRGLREAEAVRHQNFWPKMIWIDMFELNGIKDKSNVHVVSYRRARNAHRLYGQDASWIPGAVSLTAPLQNLGYLNLERFADIIVEVPRDSRKADVHRQEVPCAPSLLRYYRFEMLLGACVSMWAAHALWRKLRPLKDPAGFKFFRGKHKPT